MENGVYGGPASNSNDCPGPTKYDYYALLVFGWWRGYVQIASIIQPYNQADTLGYTYIRVKQSNSGWSTWKKIA